MDAVLKDQGEISKSKDGLPLASLRTDTDLGKSVLARANRVLEVQNKDALVV